MAERRCWKGCVERDGRRCRLRAFVALSRLYNCVGSLKVAKASVMSVVGSVRRHVEEGTMRRAGLLSTRQPSLSPRMEKQMRHPKTQHSEAPCLCNSNYSCPSSTTGGMHKIMPLN